MSYQAVIKRRDFSSTFLPAEEAQVIRLSWGSEGGPDGCTIALRAGQTALESFELLLRCPVEVYSEQGLLVWWGYMHAVRQTCGGYQMSVSLDGLANRVAVSYQTLTPTQAYGETMLSSWQENLRSISIYGVKERLVEGGMLSDAAAQQLAQRTLADSAFPALTCEPLRAGASEEKAARGAHGDVALVYVECRGWFETLGWKHAQVQESVVANAAPISGVQTLGNEASTSRVAQSFRFSTAVKLALIEVRLRRQGTPSDNLLLEIQGDLGGQPDGMVLFSASLSGASLAESSYAYVSIAVPSLLNLSDDRSYWLVLRRTGANSGSHFYGLAVDEGLGYSDGQCLIYTPVPGRWQARTTPADLIFRLHAQRENFEQMGAIFAATNQFMRDCSFDGSSSPATPLFKARLVDGRAGFLELLRLGTNTLDGLGCQVGSDLSLRVSAMPARNGASFQMGADKHLRDAFGVSLAPGVHPAGAWLRYENGPLLFVHAAELDCLSGVMRISS